MFLGLSLTNSKELQATTLILNSVVLIAVLIMIELIYSEAPQSKRKHLKYAFPLIVVFVGLLVYAAYRQIAA